MKTWIGLPARRWLAGSLLLLMGTALVAQPNEISVVTGDNTELTLTRYPAEGPHLILWLAAGFEPRESERKFIERVAQLGVEVWLIDFADALYQPHSNQLLRRLNPDYVADLIQLAHQRTAKAITLAGHSYAGIPILNGAYRWQQRRPSKAYLTGAILFSPDLYAQVPSLGLDPVYIEALAATTIPIFIYQDQKRNTTRQLPTIVNLLRANQTPLYLKVLPGVTGLFYDGDTQATTLRQLRTLPNDIPRIIPLLAHTPAPLTAKSIAQPRVPSERALDSQLKPFAGNPEPPPIDLYDIKQNRFTRSDYRGKVTVVNFWATWCPPCVEEIPSLNRLRTQLQGEKFELISINFAEDPAHIRQFLNRVQVDFPVLLDQTGKTAEQWNVIVYPSTFVIAADGSIRYGVNAAIDWSAPEVVDALRALLP